MNARAKPLAGRLPGIAPARAALQSRLIAALNGREVAGLRTAAQIAGIRERHAAHGWIRFETSGREVAVAPLLADGALARMTGEQGRPDGPAAAAVLGKVEPLIAAIETILELPLYPAGLSDSVPDDRLMLRFDGVERGGMIRHRLLLAVTDDLDVSPLPAPAGISPALSLVKLRWRGVIAGPSVPVARLGRAGPGDLILLGAGPIALQVRFPGSAALQPARLDLPGRQAVLTSDHDEGTHDMSNRAESVAAEAGGGDGDPLPEALNHVAVPIRIEIEGGTVAAGALATMAAGSVLPIPAEGGTLPVRIMAGDTLWASGELVAVGEGYGVLVGALSVAER